MKTEWDYTSLADAYLKRPDYSEEAIEEMLKRCLIKENDLVCDIGAGTAHLTLMLAKRKLNVCAIEPNDAMRNNGICRTKNLENITWFEGVGEDTKQSDNKFDLVTFGSSFNVTDRKMALKESYRILNNQKYFACMWNHRDLNDPLQAEMEKIIKKYVPDYNYGTRHEDQTETILNSGLFENVEKIEGRVLFNQNILDWIEAWRSHATLQRQAGKNFKIIIDEMEKFLKELGKEDFIVPYTTRIWIAKSKK